MSKGSMYMIYIYILLLYTIICTVCVRGDNTNIISSLYSINNNNSGTIQYTSFDNSINNYRSYYQRNSNFITCKTSIDFSTVDYTAQHDTITVSFGTIDFTLLSPTLDHTTYDSTMSYPNVYAVLYIHLAPQTWDIPASRNLTPYLSSMAMGTVILTDVIAHIDNNNNNTSSHAYGTLHTKSDTMPINLSQIISQLSDTDNRPSDPDYIDSYTLDITSLLVWNNPTMDQSSIIYTSPSPSSTVQFNGCIMEYTHICDYCGDDDDDDNTNTNNNTFHTHNYTSTTSTKVTPDDYIVPSYTPSIITGVDTIPLNVIWDTNLDTTNADTTTTTATTTTLGIMPSPNSSIDINDTYHFDITFNNPVYGAIDTMIVEFPTGYSRFHHHQSGNTSECIVDYTWVYLDNTNIIPTDVVYHHDVFSIISTVTPYIVTIPLLYDLPAIHPIYNEKGDTISFISISIQCPYITYRATKPFTSRDIRTSQSSQYAGRESKHNNIWPDSFWTDRTLDLYSVHLSYMASSNMYIISSHNNNSNNNTITPTIMADSIIPSTITHISVFHVQSIEYKSIVHTIIIIVSSIITAIILIPIIIYCYKRRNSNKNNKRKQSKHANRQIIQLQQQQQHQEQQQEGENKDQESRQHEQHNTPTDPILKENQLNQLPHPNSTLLPSSPKEVTAIRPYIRQMYNGDSNIITNKINNSNGTCIASSSSLPSHVSRHHHRHSIMIDDPQDFSTSTIYPSIVRYEHFVQYYGDRGNGNDNATSNDDPSTIISSSSSTIQTRSNNHDPSTTVYPHIILPDLLSSDINVTSNSNHNLIGQFGEMIPSPTSSIDIVQSSIINSPSSSSRDNNVLERHHYIENILLPFNHLLYEQRRHKIVIQCDRLQDEIDYYYNNNTSNNTKDNSEHNSDHNISTLYKQLSLLHETIKALDAQRDDALMIQHNSIYTKKRVRFTSHIMNRRHSKPSYGHYHDTCTTKTLTAPPTTTTTTITNEQYSYHQYDISNENISNNATIAHCSDDNSMDEQDYIDSVSIQSTSPSSSSSLSSLSSGQEY